MTGCTVAIAPQGSNALTVNMTCTAAAQGELDLYKTLQLKNGWRIGGVAIGSLSGGSYEPRMIPLAGSTEPAMRIGISGAPNAAPVVFVSVDLYGPVGSSAY